MSDIEIQALGRALRRNGVFRFVALGVPRSVARLMNLATGDTRSPKKHPSGEKVTVVSRCGPPDFRNLSRDHKLAIPVYTLDDLVLVEKEQFAYQVYDLELRRFILQPGPDTRELEEGWTRPSFEKLGTLKKLYRPVLSLEEVPSAQSSP